MRLFKQPPKNRQGEGGVLVPAAELLEAVPLKIGRLGISGQGVEPLDPCLAIVAF